MKNERDSNGRFSKGRISPNKGKSFEEIYGKKRAKEIKEKLWNKERKIATLKGIFVFCNTCGKEIYIVPKKFKFKNHFCSIKCCANFQKGRKVSEKQKQQISATLKRKHIITRGSWKKGHIPWHKGLTKETDKRVKIISQKLRVIAVNRKPKYRDNKIELSLDDAFKKINLIRGKDYLAHIPILNLCIPDKVFLKEKIAVFCDGDYWHNLPGYKERDNNQNKVLKENGWEVLRFWEHELKENSDNCAKTVQEVLRKRT